MKYFLENRLTAWMIFAACLIFGIIGLKKLPLSLMPAMNYPGLTVIIEYPGITPDKIETIITKPVEQTLRSVPGIESITSVSEEGKSRVNVNFHTGTDIAMAALRVRERISLLRGGFPRAVQEPMVVRYDPSDRPAVIAAVERIPGEKPSLTEVREYAERVIKPRLQRIEGVSEVYAAGGLRKEIHVAVDPGKFSARSLDFERLFAVLQEGGLELPAGKLTSGGREYHVRTAGRYRSPGEIADTVVHLDGERAVRVADFAEVKESHREAEDLARLDGKERVLLYVHRSGDANTLRVSEEAAKVFGSIEGCGIRVVYSQGDYIRAAVGNVVASGVWGLLIVFFAVFAFYRDISRALMIGVSIPFSIITVFACMYFAKVPIDVISLSGLALAAGMVVDNSIIVMDSISRGKADVASVHRGAREVAVAIAASTATTVAVFFPIVFGDEMTRRMYSGMAFTVSSALIISLLAATVFIPVLYLGFSGRPRACCGRPGAFLPRRKGNSATKPEAAPRRIQKGESVLAGAYKTALEYAFAHRRTLYAATGAVAAAALLCLAFTRSEFIDPFTSGELYLYCEFPTGTSLRATDDAVKLVEGHVRESGIAKKVSAKIEKWRGTLVVTLKDAGPREWKALRKRLGDEANAILKPFGAFAFVAEPDDLAARELDVTFIGDDNDRLREIARNAAKKIQSIPGIDECVLRFREGKPSYRLRVDREKAGASGLSMSKIARFFHSALYGPVAIKYPGREREIDVRVKFERKGLPALKGLLAQTIQSESGASIPLKGLVSIEEGSDRTRIWRRNGRRAVTVTARIGELSFDEGAEKIEASLSSLTLPADYSWEFSENLGRERKGRRLMALLTLFSILLVFMIIAGLLESLSLPFLVITTVPLAFCGVFIALFLTGSTLNIAAFIGMIVLTGIAVNNGIVLVERIRATLPAKGPVSPEEIDAKAMSVSIRHFNPIIITAITTVLGFFPALLSGGEGSTLWRPLALTVVSGLAFSTAIVIFIIPISFKYFYASPRRTR